jgi:hypothetical protein
MNALVVYDSQYGNTKRIAQTIADTLREFGQVQVVLVNPAHPVELRGMDLLVVGCPTQGWRPTSAIQSFLEGNLSERLTRPDSPSLRYPLPDAPLDDRLRRQSDGREAPGEARPASRATGELLRERQAGSSAWRRAGSSLHVGADARQRVGSSPFCRVAIAGNHDALSRMMKIVRIGYHEPSARDACRRVVSFDAYLKS